MYETPNVTVRTRSEGNQVLSTLKGVVDQYGRASVADFFDLVGLKTQFTDTHWGWRQEDISKASVQDDNGVYRIVLPRVVSIRSNDSTTEGEPMTEAIEIRPNVCVCTNCWKEDERDTTEPVKSNLSKVLPKNWGTLVITRNEGIATNGIICDDCLGIVRNSLTDRRDAVHHDETLNKEPEVDIQRKTAIDDRIAQAKEDGAKEITVEQIGTGKTATVDISEFDGQSYQELIDASDNPEHEEFKTEETVLDSPPIPADRDISQDASPVDARSLSELKEDGDVDDRSLTEIKNDAELPPTFEESKQAALEEGKLPPKRPTNNNRRRTTSGK